LLAQAVYTYQSNQRQANAQTKDRSEVSGGGKKPWRQKGTARARHGSTRSPIWAGGGVTFGPTKERNYKKRMNKKMRKQAVRSGFSLMAKNGNVLILEKIDPKKTNEVQKIIKKMKLEDKKVTFIQEDEKGLFRSARNMDRVDAKRVGELSTYDVLNAGVMIILDEALDTISQKWGKKASKTVKSEPKKEVKKTASKKTTKKSTTKTSAKKKTTRKVTTKKSTTKKKTTKK
jgi:large subunit ribosomal protein L4